MPDFNDPSVVQLWTEKAWTLATGALLALAILILGWIASKWAGRVVARLANKLDSTVAGFLASLARYAVLAAAVIASLEAVGVQTTSLVAILGAAGLAVGLALQGSLANFASGVMILIFRPFEIGDVVSAGGETGGVIDIGLFASTLRTPDNHTIIVPNSGVTGGVITNYTREGTRRGAIDVGVAYGTSLDDVNAAVMAAVGRCDLVLTEPGIGFAFTEMAASSINFKVFVWSTTGNFLGMLHQVRSEIYNELNSRGIDIPYDQLVLHKADAG